MTTRNADSVEAPHLCCREAAGGSRLLRGGARKQRGGSRRHDQERRIQPDDRAEIGRTMSWPMTRVPTRKAADAAPAYPAVFEWLFPLPGLVALTVSASASDVVGARAMA